MSIVGIMMDRVRYQTTSDTPVSQRTVTFDASNGSSTNTITTTVNISQRNDAPTGAPTATLANGTEDVPYVVAASALLQGFSDPDSSNLFVTNLVSSSGFVTNNGNGTFTISPAPNDNGQVTLTYRVSDGSLTTSNQTRTFTLDPVNDAPTGTPTANLANGTEDVAYIVSNAALIAGINDVDGDTLTAINVMASTGSVVDNGNGTFTVTQVPDFNGDVTLTYDVSDGNGGRCDGADADLHHRPGERRADRFSRRSARHARR